MVTLDEEHISVSVDISDEAKKNIVFENWLNEDGKFTLANNSYKPPGDCIIYGQSLFADFG